MGVEPVAHVTVHSGLLVAGRSIDVQAHLLGKDGHPCIVKAAHDHVHTPSVAGIKAKEPTQ